MTQGENLGILAFTVMVAMAILAIISNTSTPKQEIRPSIHKTRKHKRKHLRGKHEFVHRPSLLDSGMDIVVPWRKDNPTSNHMKKSIFRMPFINT